MMESSLSHHCSTWHRATVVPHTRGVPPPRGCCDTEPALTRCGLPQQSPPSLGSTKTHKRSQQRRKAAQQCKRIATEVRDVLELYRLDFDRVRSLWQQDRVAGIRKPLKKRSAATEGCAEVISISLWIGAKMLVQPKVFSNVMSLVGTSI